MTLPSFLININRVSRQMPSSGTISASKYFIISQNRFISIFISQLDGKPIIPFRNQSLSARLPSRPLHWRPLLSGVSKTLMRRGKLAHQLASLWYIIETFHMTDIIMAVTPVVSQSVIARCRTLRAMLFQWPPWRGVMWKEPTGAFYCDFHRLRPAGRYIVLSYNHLSLMRAAFDNICH